jgi:hypothetical protein
VLRCCSLVALSVLLATPSRAELPDNGWVIWASDRTGGRHEVYLMKADGSGVTQLTAEGGKSPSWSPDGSWIAYNHTVDSTTHVMRPDKSGDKKVCDGEPAFWMLDGSGVVCGRDHSYTLANPDSGAAAPLFKKDDFAKLVGKDFGPGAITHDGRWLLGWSDRYRDGFTGDNGTHNSYNSAVILDLTQKSKIYFFGGGCEPTAPPSGDLVFHVSATSATHPDIYRMSLADVASRSSYAAEVAYADADFGHEYFPRISTDGQWLTYGATTGCHDHDTCDYELYLHRLGAATTERTRLTTSSANDQWAHLYVGPLWQPESKPKLVLAPAKLTFDAGAGTPSPRTVSVSNAGGATLAAVSAKASAAWLAVTAAGAGNSQELTVSADADGLSPGSHEASVEIVEPAAANSPLTLAVTLVVGGASPAQEAGTHPAGGDGGAANRAAGLVGGCALATGQCDGPSPALPSCVLLGLLVVARRPCRRRRDPGAALPRDGQVNGVSVLSGARVEVSCVLAQDAGGASASRPSAPTRDPDR